MIRAEEHLPNTPKQQLLWEALGGGEPPIWAHVPVVVNEKRQKLSKRRDKVALESYRDEGYLADAMRNYLMLLGWAPPGDREIVPWAVIVDEFRLEDVNPSPAFFDEKKLRAFNGEYIRALPLDEFIDACQPWLAAPAAPWPPEQFDADAFAASRRWRRAGRCSSSAVLRRLPLPGRAARRRRRGPRRWTATPPTLLDAVIAAFERSTAWSAPRAEGDARGDRHGPRPEAGQGAGAGPGRHQAAPSGLPLFESLEVLGRERTLTRLRTARGRALSRWSRTVRGR